MLQSMVMPMLVLGPGGRDVAEVARGGQGALQGHGAG